MVQGTEERTFTLWTDDAGYMGHFEIDGGKGFLLFGNEPMIISLSALPEQVGYLLDSIATGNQFGRVIIRERLTPYTPKPVQGVS